MSPAAARLRVVVVTYNPGRYLADLLDSLPGATSLPYEVVVADNGSTDGAPEAAVAGRPQARVLATGTNAGYGRAANLGAAADGDSWDWLLVVNPDVVLHPRALDRLVEASARWPRGGSFGPAILTPDGQLYPSARALPSVGRGIGHALLGWCWPANPWTKAYRREAGSPVEGPAGWLSGSCLLLPRAAWTSVGGFDPAYWMYMEDVDLGDRLGAAGWLNVYVPGAVITHVGGHATREHAAAMLGAHHDSAYRYLARRYPGPAQAPLRLAIRAGLAGRARATRRVSRIADGARPTRSGAELARGLPD